ncbi:MAG: glycosyltransferase family 2 protein [Rhizobiaceae bacterium]
MDSQHPTVSIVCPCHNEEDNIEPLVKRLQKTLDNCPELYEIILVDDGSADATWRVIEDVSCRYPSVRGLRLSRNFGHQNALLAGLSGARGQAIISMDSDLQHPPEVIPELLDEWRNGAQIVVTTREPDNDSASFFKRKSSSLFYRIFTVLAGIEIRKGSSDFRLIDREALAILIKFAGKDQFLRGSVEWMGYRSSVVPYVVESRNAGRTKYNFRRMIRFAATAVTSFSNRPLRAGIWLGVIVGFLALLELFYVLTVALSGKSVPGWASTVGVMSFLFAILFIMVGIIGVYISRIHSLLQDRPTYIVTESVGLPQATNHQAAKRVE